MACKLIIDGNTVYELDESCMLTKRLHGTERTEQTKKKDTKKKNK